MRLTTFARGVSAAALILPLLETQAHAQTSLPNIDVGKPKLVQHTAPSKHKATPSSGYSHHTAGSGRSNARPVAGAGGGTGAGAPSPEGAPSVGNNGTNIGPGRNGELCANGVCNDPKSYAAPVQSLGTKVNTLAIETPLATKVVTHQMLEDQQAITLDQALRNVSGVYVAGGGGAGLGVPFLGLVIRGFSTSAYYRDGIRVDNFGGAFTGVGNVELANVESIEVLKGPAAILYGAVEPGGIVNLNLKEPLEKPAYELQQQVGNYESYRTSFDMTGPLTADKSLLYRFTGSYENNGSFQTYGYDKNLMFNPVVKWNYDENTWIKASNQYQENRTDQIFSFFPTYYNVLPIYQGRSTNYGPPSPYEQQLDFAQVTWHHDFNKDWSIQQTAFMQSVTVSALNDSPSTFSDCITPGGACYGAANTVQVLSAPYTISQRQAEYATVVDVTGHFRTQEIEHTALIGADYYRFNARSQNLSAAQSGSVSLFGAPVVPPTASAGLVPLNADEQYADNVGAYVQDQMKLPYGFQVLAGARYQYINNRTGATDSANVCGPYSVAASNGVVIPCDLDALTQRGQTIDQRVTPRAAVLWRAAEWLSFYGNYVESYSPNYNGFLNIATNQPDAPSAGQQEEAGVKLALLDNKLQISSAYYHLVKTNIPVGIPNDYVHNIVVGEGRAQGPELDIQGELARGWTVNLTFSNTDSKITKATPFPSLYNPPIGSPVPYVPRNQASISSNYEFKDGALTGLKVGARYDYTGYLPFFNYYNDGSYIYGLNTPSYGLVGILASYEFHYGGYKIHAQLNVDNLLDRTYFTSGGKVPNPVYQDNGGPTPGWTANYLSNTVFGAPRTIRGLIKVAF